MITKVIHIISTEKAMRRPIACLMTGRLGWPVLLIMVYLWWNSLAAFVQAQTFEQSFESTTPPFTAEELNRGVVEETLELESAPLNAELIGTTLFNFSVFANEEDPIALFRRGRNLWLAVSQPEAFRDTELSDTAREYIQLVEDVSTPQFSVMRMIIDENINPRLVFSRNENQQDIMLLYFFEQPLEPQNKISVEVEIDQLNGRPYILIADRESHDLVEVFDSEVGQTIVIMPSVQQGYGVAEAYEYLDINIFPSYQGAAVMLRRDDLRVRKYDFGYTINAESDLHITAGGNVNRRELILGDSRFLNAENWLDIRPSEFIAVRNELLQNIITSPVQKRTEPRMALAQLYLSQGWGSDARAILDYAAFEDNSLVSKEPFIHYRLAAEYFMRRYEEVEIALKSPEFMVMRDASIWRGAVLAHQERWAEAYNEFELSESILRRYPARLRNHFGLLFARVAINMQRYDLAGVWLDIVTRGDEALGHYERNTLNYLQGQYALANQQWDTARTLFARLQHQDDKLNSVRARYALLSLERREGKLDDNQMIEALTTLRQDARQLPIEVTITRQLVDVLLDRRLYLRAMRLMREMTTFELGEEQNRQLVARMQETLNQLFLNIEQNDDVLPLRVVAIFDEFRELTPVGERGNRIINNLINKLISMDLLDQAEDMLAYQIRYRVFGEERILLGTKLAVVALLNGNPALAIKALNENQFGNISEQLGRHRRLLLANALANLGEKEEALKQLAGDISLNADLLRREIFWRDRDWSELAKTIRRLVTAVNPDSSTLNALQARYIMNWIVALQMENNLVGVQEVVSQYRDQMLNSDFGPMFAFLVADNRRESTDAVERVLNDTMVFDTFLEVYERELLDNTLEAYVLEDIDDDIDSRLLTS